jgi:hypothetical protein
VDSVIANNEFKTASDAAYRSLDQLNSEHPTLFLNQLRLYLDLVTDNSGVIVGDLRLDDILSPDGPNAAEMRALVALDFDTSVALFTALNDLEQMRNHN